MLSDQFSNNTVLASIGVVDGGHHHRGERERERERDIWNFQGLQFITHIKNKPQSDPKP